MKLALFNILCVYIWLSWELEKSYTATKDTLCLCSWLHTTLLLLWTHVLEPTLCSVFWAWLPSSMSQAVNVWLSALESHSWLTMSFVFSSRLAGFHGHSSLCGLRTKIEKGISKHFGTASKMLKMISLATRNIHTHTYIHTHTLMLIMPRLLNSLLAVLILIKGLSLVVKHCNWYKLWIFFPPSVFGLMTFSPKYISYYCYKSV